jgi:hypothetical protein
MPTLNGTFASAQSSQPADSHPATGSRDPDDSDTNRCLSRALTPQVYDSARFNWWAGARARCRRRPQPPRPSRRLPNAALHRKAEMPPALVWGLLSRSRKQAVTPPARRPRQAFPVGPAAGGAASSSRCAEQLRHGPLPARGPCFWARGRRFRAKHAMGVMFDGNGICKSRAYLKRDSELLTGGAGPRGPVLMGVRCRVANDKWIRSSCQSRWFARGGPR